MKRGIIKKTNCLCSCSGKPIKIVGIACSKRAEDDCAKENPSSTAILKIALAEAEKNGAETELIDLRNLKINPCKECYSTCPSQCRFNEKAFQCDCYMFKEDTMFISPGNFMSIQQAYEKLDKKKFFEIYNAHGRFAQKDDMHIIYKALMEADGIIIASPTIFYSRAPLLQIMFSRLTALDGGVEELWGDGKNLNNSIKYAKNPKSTYKQRLYGKKVAFVNVSKEGDSVTPNLMKACTMMGMSTIPLGVAYNVNWYNDSTHQKDKLNAIKDPYTISLAKHLGKKIVEEIKYSPRKYGMLSSTV